MGADLEWSTTDKDDHDLQTDDEDYDANEEQVAMNTLEYVEFVVEAAVVEDIEDLHPHKAVENEGVELELLVGVGEVVAEDFATCEVEYKDDSELVDVLAHDLLPHGCGDERFVATLWWAI